MLKKLCLALTGIALINGANATEWSEKQIQSPIGDIKVEEIASSLNYPWGMTFLPNDNGMLITEREGTLRHMTIEGQISKPITGLPEILSQGQGGLLDITLDPEFQTNRWVYLSYTEPGPNSTNGTAVARAQLSSDMKSLESVEVIFSQKPKKTGSHHFGSRLAFAKDGTLFITTGERFSHANEAQDLNSHLGKLIRINKDGSIPKDNPFIKDQNAQPEIWSYGHRNMQGLALNPWTGEIWEHEHGPRGGDEVNIPKAGKNYGWPIVSYGSHYSRIPIPDEHASKGFEEPHYYWTPSIAPSGMAFYKSEMFPELQGDLLIGSLVLTHLNRLDLDENFKVVKEERWLEDLNLRIRDVEIAKDGSIYLLVDDSDGQVLRLSR
jgi:glucose/arabinose dehydrogenase